MGKGEHRITELAYVGGDTTFEEGGEFINEKRGTVASRKIFSTRLCAGERGTLRKSPTTSNETIIIPGGGGCN